VYSDDLLGQGPTSSLRITLALSSSTRTAMSVAPIRRDSPPSRNCWALWALLVSGLASTSIGCYSGSIITDGLLRRRLPVFVRRLVTLLPAVALLSLGTEPTSMLVISQVVLSFGIPFVIVPLVLTTSRRTIMGSATNHPTTTIIATGIAATVVLLNVYLIYTLISA
jgi:manganese transport protein